MTVISGFQSFQDLRTAHDAPAFRTFERLDATAQERTDKILDLDSNLRGARDAKQDDIAKLTEQLADLQRLAGHHDRELLQGLRDDGQSAERREQMDRDMERLKKRRAKLQAELKEMPLPNLGDVVFTQFAVWDKRELRFASKPAPTNDRDNPRKMMESILANAESKLAKGGDIDDGFLPEDDAHAKARRDLFKLAKIKPGEEKDLGKISGISVAPCTRLRADGITNRPIQRGLGFLNVFDADRQEVVPDVAALFFRKHFRDYEKEIDRQIKAIYSKAGVSPRSIADREAAKAAIADEAADLLFKACAWFWRAIEDGQNVLPPVLDVPRSTLVKCWLQIVPVTEADAGDFDFG